MGEWQKMKSIIQDEKRCYITGTNKGLEEHHIFGAWNRNNSEKYGLKIWLRRDWHRGCYYAIHENRELDLQIKKMAQTKWEEKYGTREDFINIFGKSWLE